MYFNKNWNDDNFINQEWSVCLQNKVDKILNKIASFALLSEKLKSMKWSTEWIKVIETH